MRRSQAPTAVMRKRGIEVNAAAVGDEGAEKNPLKRLALALHPLPAKPEEDGTKEDGSNSDEEEGDGLSPYIAETAGVPYYFVGKWEATSKKNGTHEEVGFVEVSRATVRVLSRTSKQVGCAQLQWVGEPVVVDKANEVLKQRAAVKNKPVVFAVGRRVPVGTKRILLLKEVSCEEFRRGDAFIHLSDKAAAEEPVAGKPATKPSYIIPAARKNFGGFVCPFKGAAVPRKRTEPLHDPHTPDAVVLYMPSVMAVGKVAVVVDPALAKCLRPHQRAGVQFMFDCTMGLKPGMQKKNRGCILADGMGLGKTIQAITLTWTLLKQGPDGEPAVKKALIVAPSSLVSNWQKEFKKWLGDQVQVVGIGESSKTADSKINALQYGDASVLVISYDQLKIRAKKIYEVKSIGLVICDEGHKLKNAKIKTSQAVSGVPTLRRIILSGTPIQNDLEEFYAMVNFVNPGALGDVDQFKNVWEVPILNAKNPDATPEEKSIGVERSKELIRLTSQFILRRSNTINQKYLPPKTEYTVFCKLTPLQTKLYKELVARQSTPEKAEGLQVITGLKKLCNHPQLLQEMCLPDTDCACAFPWLAPSFPDGLAFDSAHSGKMLFLETLLQKIHAARQKIVIVSNYTQTLQALGRWCKHKGYEFFQLDGQLSVPKRQQFVDLFNDQARPEFIFLLSSKAGGCGLNLIGGCHLVMLDPDWNPANDDQAMARVWRDGQKNTCRLYRLLATGTIEEKIYQRQISKLALSTRVVDNTDVESQFTTNDLRDLFKLNDATICDTHDLLNCKCAPSKKVLAFKRRKLNIDLLSAWQHCYQVETLGDPFFSGMPESVVSFVMHCTKDASMVEEEAINEDPSVVGEDADAGDKDFVPKTKGAKESASGSEAEEDSDAGSE
eukprot:TRINITY_DN8706_c0_g1_i1.p1 TRINITY_DN8706_c0_g1~~TRINITY_DN8706_c0_g1_i1.p1  ORF type:complete len:893 (-),score=240.89 TRINITY_DN8706_c0_g1_i1:49-2727(-)